MLSLDTMNISDMKIHKKSYQHTNPHPIPSHVIIIMGKRKSVHLNAFSIAGEFHFDWFARLSIYLKILAVIAF